MPIVRLVGFTWSVDIPAQSARPAGKAAKDHRYGFSIGFTPSFITAFILCGRPACHFIYLGTGKSNFGPS